MRNTTLGLVILLSIVFVVILAWRLFYPPTPPVSGGDPSTKGWPMVVSRQDPPKLSFDKEIYDLGTVVEGVEVPYTIALSNIGGEPLRIKDVNTSCGCTLTKLREKVIMPGKSTQLEVVLDTAMKQGPVRKTIDITSNDPKRPKAVITLSATVLPKLAGTNTLSTTPGISVGSSTDTTPNNPLLPTAPLNGSDTMDDPHAGMSLSGKVNGKAKIFTGQCATCHVKKGIGKTGKALFQADCGMCHGMNGRSLSDHPNATAPALIPRDYQNPQTYARLKRVIESGSPVHPSMPGFLDRNGGPLTQSQVDSLIDYLQSTSAADGSATTQQPIP